MIVESQASLILFLTCGSELSCHSHRVTVRVFGEVMPGFLITVTGRVTVIGR